MLTSPFFAEALKKWVPAADNLFEVRIASSGSEFDVRQYAILHCTKVRFAGSGVEFSRHKTTREFVVEGYQPADEVTITWRENRNLDVRRFHEDWQALFYDREKDQYISTGARTSAKGKASRLKKLSIVIQASPSKLVSTDEEFPAVRTLVLEDVMPPMTPELELDWAAGNAVEYSLTYKVGKWYWED